ncbi:Alkaline phosphatase synthesis transcriptional regulatory protein PhoP [Aquisphaera giovannonii]|uniref:Alkaline phosphatase synthesis transcriptional regulatory protein PhoP n=1 Tax=Aquisphaera giovannonii TaxID=406548 RepID=A0A5B9WBH9_9BACT|nr:response regulator [Aquisphaera giovannonii]QEH37624.1 Alkaline phosphatase synthesis transcriptional regulatory protein PhoP [Aquisphaera giovannonii]
MRVHADPALRVLVVDDNVDTAASLALLFESWGHEVAQAHDGPQAIRVAHEMRPHAVVLDVGLPLMDGFEVAQKLRQLPGGDRVLIVCSSGFNREVDRRRADEVGIDEYLVKPFDPFALEGMLAACRPSRQALSA